jgi:hypothetical protein
MAVSTSSPKMAAAAREMTLFFVIFSDSSLRQTRRPQRQTAPDGPPSQGIGTAESAIVRVFRYKSECIRKAALIGACQSFVLFGQADD